VEIKYVSYIFASYLTLNRRNFRYFYVIIILMFATMSIIDMTNIIVIDDDFEYVLYI